MVIDRNMDRAGIEMRGLVCTTGTVGQSNLWIFNVGCSEQGLLAFVIF
jgi:hypothetical protein